MYEDILFPFDGSEGAAETLHHAAEIANWTDGEIQLLYVADTTEYSTTRVQSTVVDGQVEHGEDVLETAAETLDSLAADYSTDVVQGAPAETIVEYAEKYDYDVIVMPTQGRQGLSRYLLGSVTEKVVRLSSIPVLTSRMNPDDAFEFPYEQLLLATDGSQSAEHAAMHGLDLAAALDATVHALSAVETAVMGPDVEDVTNAGRDAAEEAVDTIANAAQRRGIDDIVRHVEDGAPAETILDVIESEDIDAVVMGTTGRRGITRILLGSVAEKTVRSAPVPVITVHGPDEAE
ncbi:universal stress protein [Halapricum salinum]|uniref:Universal stress protein n=1 Tax=Halapricum salinum TaxID=1457250 RepID=A0A4D6H8D6_9EURY|nr:universal stress protein [Halapricum salinum]QCC50123.1 universal stress protein [Halapricum salinum]